MKTDKRSILIGERIQYDITCKLPSPGYAVSFRVPDSVSHFIFVENQPVDTTAGSIDFMLHKKIVFTSFDSGSWHIPSFEIQVERSPYNLILKTDSILVDVGYSPADSTGQLRDIKPVIDVTVDDYTLYYIMAGVLLLIILGVLIYRYIRKRHRNQGVTAPNALPAYEEAMDALMALEQYDLNDAARVKMFHTLLANIFKRYCSRKLGTGMMNKTTGELLLAMQRHNDSDFLSKIAMALRSGDAVKFAKFLPAPAESTSNLIQIKEAIGYLENVHSITKQ